jgi:hypothetical protein
MPGTIAYIDGIKFYTMYPLAVLNLTYNVIKMTYLGN